MLRLSSQKFETIKNIERHRGSVAPKAMGGRGGRLDDLDRAILGHLNQNARRSFREIARGLGVSISTVSGRVRALEEHGVIRGYIPLIDPASLGYGLPVVIGLRISHGRTLEVQKNLAKDPRVQMVYDVTGEWDSVVTASFRTTRELNDFIKRVSSMENIERTYTQVVLNIVKEEKRVHP